MAVSIFFEGPSGGRGGDLIDLENPNAQPHSMDLGQAFPGSETVYDIISKDDCRIREIIVRSGDHIDAVAVSYVGTNDSPYGTFKMGGNGGEEQILQLSEGEYITIVQGEYSTVLSNFEIQTNRNVAYAFGTSGDISFKYLAPPGYQIIGFWGGAGHLVDRIGVAIRSISVPVTQKAKAPKKKSEKTKDKASKPAKKTKKSK
jgi:Jacalin-like lectin domain